MAYVLHLRPLEWPIISAHFLLGSFLAVGLRLPWKAAVLGWFIFVVLLNGGTLALNSVFDRDTGDIGYLKQPPPPPKYLLHFSSLLLALSILLSLFLPRLFAEINLTCVLMSVLYSVPPIRLKARAGWDLLINCVGFGFFTPLAGWALTGIPFSKPIWSAAIGFSLLFGALYPLTQLYQMDEDRERGDKTLVLLLGGRKSLGFAIGFMVVAHLWFVQAILQAKRSPLLLLFSLLAWLSVLIPWLHQWQRMSGKQHERGMYRALLAWAITDLNLLILLWPK